MAQNRRYPPSHPKAKERAARDAEQAKGWQPFEYVPDQVRNYGAVADFTGVAAADIMEATNESVNSRRRFRNNKYTVVVESLSPEGMRGILHLDIVRNDREAIHDWREIQRIKNELCGPEREAVELYPAQSRLYDTANNFHLWVMPEGERAPVGWDMQLVVDAAVASQMSCKQRPFAADDPTRELCLTEEQWKQVFAARKRADGPS